MHLLFYSDLKFVCLRYLTLYHTYLQILRVWLWCK